MLQALLHETLKEKNVSSHNCLPSPVFSRGQSRLRMGKEGLDAGIGCFFFYIDARACLLTNQQRTPVKFRAIMRPA